MHQDEYYTHFKPCNDPAGRNKLGRHLNITKVIKAREAGRISEAEAQQMWAEVKKTNPDNAEMLKKDLKMLCSIADEFNGAVFVRVDKQTN